MAHHSRSPLLLVGATAVLLLMAPALGARASGPPAPAHAVAQVSIQNVAFSPRTLIIAAGTTVVWTNRDMPPTPSPAIAAPGPPRPAWASSARLAAGQSFTLTFSRPGAYTYHCAVHLFMTAAVIVRAATQASSAPPMRMSSRQTVLLQPLGGSGVGGSGVSGSAVFSYNAVSGRTTVFLTAGGLQPGTAHPAHIHVGSDCTATQPILATFVPLNGMGMRGMRGMGLRADRSGTVRGRATIAGPFLGQTGISTCIRDRGSRRWPSSEFWPVACCDSRPTTAERETPEPRHGQSSAPAVRAVPLGCSSGNCRGRTLFGPSLAALHVLPALAGALIVVATGLMACEMGGGRRAQGLAALCALVAPAFVGASALFTMDIFDELWWTLATLVLVRILSAYGSQPEPAAARGADTARGRLWLMFGLVCGLGLLTKLTILAFGLAVTLGLLLTPARAALRTRWPYLAAALALAFLLPYGAWQVGHDWATRAFWHDYHHGQDTGTFLVQVVLLMQPLALPLWAVGLWYLLRDPAGAPYRALGWAFLILCGLFLLGHAKSYFLVPAFPPLLAAGAVTLERYTRRQPHTRLVPLTIGALVLGGIALAPVVAPILPPRTLAAVMPSPI